MLNYALMYQTLFRSVTKAITILQEAQQPTEEMYISGEEPIITIFPSDSENENEDIDHS